MSVTADGKIHVKLCADSRFIIALSILYFPSFYHVFFMKSAYVLRGILLSLDTNLHKVQTIIGSREANYFADKITPPPFLFINF